MPLPPLPDSALQPYLRVHGTAATLQNPSRDFVIQGVLVAVLLPVAWVLLGFLVVLGEPRAWGPVLAGVAGLSGLSVALAVVVGGVGWLRARGRATRVEEDGTLLLPGGRRLSPGDVAEVRVGQPSALLKWKGIAARTPAGETVWLLQRLPPSRVRLLEGLARWLGAATGAPVDVSDAALTLGLNRNSLAALCYVPVQGIWLLASVGVLLWSRDPATRFAAKQSLAFYLGSGVLLVAWCVLVAVPGFLLAEATRLREVAAVFVILLIVVPALARIVLGVVAAFRASRGSAWIIPGMGFLVRRWLPPTGGTP